jgi:hypothetical protein
MVRTVRRFTSVFINAGCDTTLGLGGPGYTVYASYSAAIFFCGGSGISFGLSTVQELVQRDLERTSRVKFIELIWCVQDPGKQ